MANKTVAQGTDLQLSIANTYTSIPAVMSVTPPNRTRVAIDFTDLSMQWKEFAAGTMDGGEVSAEINYDPGNATHLALHDAFEDDSSSWKIILADSGTTTITFTGIMTELSEPQLTVDGKAMVSIKIKVSGEPVLS
jgi:predicted secreted protein